MKLLPKTMQTQLKLSPLVIEHHEFCSIRINAADIESPKGQQSLRAIRHLERVPNEPRRWVIVLRIEFFSMMDAEPAPYTGEIVARGRFAVNESYPAERESALIEVTAASILYGACREMLASFTARSSHGILSLPSVSFSPMSEVQSGAATTPKKSGRKLPQAPGKTPKK
jgi:preprotein translocase subunit SecB